MNGDFLATRMYWRLPESCGSLSVWEERKKSRAKRGSLSEPRKPHKSQKTVAPTAECCLFFSLVEPKNAAG